MTSTTDRIERTIVLRVPRSRVWQALTEAQQFGQWFGVALNGPFTPGARVQATVTSEKYTDLTFDFMIEQIVPERLFSWRWYPSAVDGTHDFSGEPTTLVEFHLEEVAGGTRVTVIESGFDKVPLPRRLTAYRDNEQGWTQQMVNLERHVTAG